MFKIPFSFHELLACLVRGPSIGFVNVKPLGLAAFRLLIWSLQAHELSECVETGAASSILWFPPVVDLQTPIIRNNIG